MWHFNMFFAASDTPQLCLYKPKWLCLWTESSAHIRHLIIAMRLGRVIKNRYCTARLGTLWHGTALMLNGQGQDKGRTRTGQGHDKSRTMAGQGQDKGGTRPGQGRDKADKTGTRLGRGQDKAGTRPWQGRDKGRTRTGQGRVHLTKEYFHLWQSTQEFAKHNIKIPVKTLIYKAGHQNYIIQVHCAGKQ